MPTRYLTIEDYPTGLTTVGYRLVTGATGIAAARVGPVSEVTQDVVGALASPPGLYGAEIAFAAGFRGGILWDDGQTPPTYAFAELYDTAAEVWAYVTRVLTAGGGGATAAEVRAEIDSNSTQLAAIKLITDRVGGAIELDGAVYRLTANALEMAPGVTAAAVWAGANVDGYTAEAALKLMLAVLAGKLSGAGTATEVIRAANDSKVRVTATVTAEGNRTAIVLDAT